MSKCLIKISAEKLENFMQLTEAIDKSLELAKRGTEQIKTEIELFKQIRKFHQDYDVLTNALKAKTRTKSEISLLKRELFTLVRKRIYLLRNFNKHCDDFKTDMNSMFELQAFNDLECELDGEGESEYEDADDVNVRVSDLKPLPGNSVWRMENWFSPSSSCTTFV